MPIVHMIGGYHDGETLAVTDDLARTGELIHLPIVQADAFRFRRLSNAEGPTLPSSFMVQVYEVVGWIEPVDGERYIGARPPHEVTKGLRP